MLRGHETLLRLVGKRRKLHPSTLSLSPGAVAVQEHELVCVSTDIVKTSSCAEVKVSFTKTDRADEEAGAWDWVKCPICRKSIQGTDSAINNHVDMCLLWGTKRKSTQLTLFSSLDRIKETSGSDVSKKGKKQNDTEKMTSAYKIRSDPLPSSSCEVEIPWVVEECLESAVPSGGSEWVKGSMSGRAQEDAPCTSTTSCNGFLVPHLGKRSNKGEAFTMADGDVGTISFHRNGYKEALPLECVISRGQGESVGPGILPTTTGKPNLEVECSAHLGIWGVETQEAPEMVCTHNCHFMTVSSMPANGAHIAVSEDRIKVKVPAADVEYPEREFDGPQRIEEDKHLVGVMQTLIVGRKYNQETVCEGMEVALLRDPENPKDASAIKVISFNMELMLGHLPRRVAHHLSVLLDKSLVQIKGSVISVPESMFEAVPVKLDCRRKNFEPMYDNLLAKDWHQAVEASLVPSISQSNLHKYQTNFLCLLQTVLDRDSHLFSDDEQAFLSSFKDLSDDAQCLFIHLYQRKGPWFRTSSINYRDVFNVKSASKELCAARYMTLTELTAGVPEKLLRETMEVVNVFELRQLVSSAKVKKKSEAAVARREELVDWVISAVLQKGQALADGGCSGLAILDMLSEIVGTCICVSDYAAFLFWRLQRLFFLNGEQELSAFLLVDMGMVKYPKYECRRSRPVFATREDLLAYEEALGVAQAMDMALEINDLTKAMGFLERARIHLQMDQARNSSHNGTAPSFLYHFSAAQVYSTVCTLGVSILEREHKYTQAVELLKELLCIRYKSGRRGYWTVRLSTDLDHLGRKEESLQVAEAGVNDSCIRGGDRLALQRRVIRLSKPPRRWRRPSYAESLERKWEEIQIRGRPLNCTAGLKSRFYGYDGQQCGVEELALQYYASEEGGRWQGMHSEGGVWMTLFGLLMWDILFTDVADVFQTPFQTAPLDLDTDAFYAARQPMIEARLQDICKGKASEILAQSWSNFCGTLCRGVNWDKYSLEVLQTIVACIRGPGLSAICRLLAVQHGGWTAGMPDLLLWRTYYPQALSTSKKSSCPGCGSHQGRMGEENEMVSFSSEISNPFEGGVRKENGQVLERFQVVKAKTAQLQGEAKLVEVKGPRDRLSDQQHAWIVILLDAGVSVQVCKVLEDVTD